MKKEKILVTGGTGLVGTALKEIIPNAIFLSSKNCDLRCRYTAHRTIKELNPDKIIHLAACVGGVGANQKGNALFYYDNIMINTNVLHSAYLTGVKKVLSLLSTCIYPENAPLPLKEEDINNGEPHKTNFGYAYSKRMLYIQSRAYREQYGCNFITIVPNNLFGPNDNFNLEKGHVIPSIIHKVYRSKYFDEDLILWGDGTPLREFTYVNDLVKIIMTCLKKYNDSEVLNVGNTQEFSIKYIAEFICSIMGYDSKKIIWDYTKPNGIFRKPSDNSRFLSLGIWGKENYISFENGIREACKWFIDNYETARK